MAKYASYLSLNLETYIKKSSLDHFWRHFLEGQWQMTTIDYHFGSRCDADDLNLSILASARIQFSDNVTDANKNTTFRLSPKKETLLNYIMDIRRLDYKIDNKY